MGAPPPAEDRHLSPEDDSTDDGNNEWMDDEDEDQTDWMTATIPHTVGDLETLVAILAEDSPRFHPTPDVAWLRCASLHPPSSGDLTGLPYSDCYTSVEYYQCDESLPSIPADRTWGLYDESVRPSVVRWVDLRIHPPHLTTRQDVVVFLRSIFEKDVPNDCKNIDAYRNRRSPWYASSSSTLTEDADCIILVLPQREQEHELLSSFMISDICPAYALYSSLDISTLALQDPDHYPWLLPVGASSPDAHLWVYRRLPSRPFLSALHPITKALVPTKGCLWETVFTYPKVEEEGDDDDDDSKNPAVPKEPEISYRLVGPPYMDVAALDPALHSLQTLLRPEVRAVLQREVARIADYFIAWPEPQHYETKEAATTWNVFPLCHTFPGHDITQRQWIPRTCTYVPETVTLLRDCFAPSRDGHPQWLLRTALYSRLAPDAVLQAHTGWADLANSVVRIHIPIVLPEDDDAKAQLCGTWVDGCVRSHRYGEMILFDDSKIHRAYNYSSTQARTVLILDVLRPEHWPPGTAVGGHSPELDAFIAQFQSEDAVNVERNNK